MRTQLGLALRLFGLLLQGEAGGIGVAELGTRHGPHEDGAGQRGRLFTLALSEVSSTEQPAFLFIYFKL